MPSVLQAKLDKQQGATNLKACPAPTASQSAAEVPLKAAAGRSQWEAAVLLQLLSAVQVRMLQAKDFHLEA